jgi:hypothetical protein
VDVATGALNQLGRALSMQERSTAAQLLLFFEENNKRYITKDEKKMEELWEWTGKEFKEHGL